MEGEEENEEDEFPKEENYLMGTDDDKIPFPCFEDIDVFM